MEAIKGFDENRHGDAVEFLLDEGALSEGKLDETVLQDMTSLGADLAEMHSLLEEEDRLTPGETPRISVTFLGKGQTVETAQFGFQPADGQSLSEASAEASAEAVTKEPRYVDDTSWTVVRVETGNEFRVSIPRALLRKAGRRAERYGLHLGSEAVDESGEVGLFEGSAARIGPVANAWSNGQDTRVLKGTYNVAQTHSVYRKLVSLGNNGGCSGTLVGPKHIVTAGHCIRDTLNSRWASGTAYAGRSGQNAWRASASFGTTSSTSTWYWVPSQFLSLADGNAIMPWSATPYDIAVIVTHTSRLGNSLGWLGWYWWASDSDFGNRVRYNRGYPLCGRSNSPANCQPLGLYGDNRYCATGNHDSQDSDGINRRFRFHCDTSGGHSGSSLYHYLNGNTPVVTGVFSWEHCFTCTSSDNRPNTGVRITKQYSDAISWLRQTFP